MKLEEATLGFEVDCSACAEADVAIDDQVASGDHFDGTVCASTGAQAAIENLQVADIVDDDGAVIGGCTQLTDLGI